MYFVFLVNDMKFILLVVKVLLNWFCGKGYLLFWRLLLVFMKFCWLWGIVMIKLNIFMILVCFGYWMWIWWFFLFIWVCFGV